MKAVLVIAAVLLAVVFIGCAAGPNPSINVANDADYVAGFWRGLWHGFISPIAFVISLFAHGVHFYEVHNNGGWYNFGFVIGAGILFGGGFAGTRRR